MSDPDKKPTTWTEGTNTPVEDISLEDYLKNQDTKEKGSIVISAEDQE